MPTLHRDYETQSAAPIKKVGARRYAADPTTRVLCICFAVDDGLVESFIPGSGAPIPQAFFTARDDPSWFVAAHNDPFESAIEEHVLACYGFPLVPIERHICTMAMARYRGLPGELGKAAALLQLPVQKDRDGARLMLELCRPRKARKGEDKAQLRWPEITPEKLARLVEYCRNDVAVEREIFRRLPRLPEDEHRLWFLDRKINVRGFAVDVALAATARELVQAEKAHINAKMRAVTAGAVDGFTKLNDMREFINARGHNMSKTNRRAVTAVLAHDPDDTVREVLELRQASSNTAVEKYNAVLAGAFPDRRVRGLLAYYGAHTGRWTSAGFNAHNLPREDADDALAAIAAIQSGDLERVRAFGPPLDVIARVARGLVVAPPNRLLVAGDFTTIEPRTAAWFAEESWKLDSFRAFDETSDPLLDPYRVLGARTRGRPVDPNDAETRQHGKTVTMAFNYGASVPVWRNHVPNDPRSDEEIKAQEVEKFRRLHPAQTRFMYDLDAQALRCVKYSEPVQRKRHSFEMDGDMLILRLPSGRPLLYPRAHIKRGKFGKDVVAYHAANKNREVEMWYGAWLANLVSSAARDLLVNALFNLDAAGFDITLHVHDEIVAEIDPTSVERDRERFKTCMLHAPAWAEGLPLAAKVRVGPRYIKADAPVEITAPTPIDPVVPVELSIEIPTEMPRDPPPLETPTPTPPPPRYNGFAHDNFDSEISLRDVVGQPLNHNKVHCPFHDDATPSCHIYHDHYHCFACGAHGDAISWLMEVEGVSFTAAQDALACWEPRQRPAAELADDGKTLERARQLWDAAQPIAGTRAADYLTFRHIDVDQLPNGDAPALRFHPNCPFGEGVRHPCLLALFQDVDSDAFAGIHRIALTASAFAPGGTVERRMLGRWPGRRAIKLWPASRVLFVGEGVETVLAAATRLAHKGHPLRPAWAMASAGALARCGPIADVDCVVILADNDPTGRRDAQDCAQLWSAGERKAVVLTPRREGEDFNDVVRRRAS
jgi:CHC2 zinc finger/DNA polymerase family A/Toprim domain